MVNFIFQRLCIVHKRPPWFLSLGTASHGAGASRGAAAASVELFFSRFGVFFAILSARLGAVLGCRVSLSVPVADKWQCFYTHTAPTLYPPTLYTTTVSALFNLCTVQYAETRDSLLYTVH